MFFNGESFSSDSKRIKFLSSGKLSLQFKPIEIASQCAIGKIALIY